jgi:putative FmdB family regulatory protein
MGQRRAVPRAASRTTPDAAFLLLCVILASFCFSNSFPLNPQGKPQKAMPIYAYACEACGHRQDHLQKMADAPIAACPECGSDTYSKQLSAPQFQLKGGGWYVTDFRDNGKKDGKKSDSGADGKSDTKADAKSDGAETKSDAKSDSKGDAKTESKSESATPAKTDSAASTTTSTATKAA